MSEVNQRAEQEVSGRRLALPSSSLWERRAKADEQDGGEAEPADHSLSDIGPADGFGGRPCRPTAHWTQSWFFRLLADAETGALPPGQMAVPDTHKRTAASMASTVSHSLASIVSADRSARRPAWEGSSQTGTKQVCRAKVRLGDDYSSSSSSPASSSSSHSHKQKEAPTSPPTAEWDRRPEVC